MNRTALIVDDDPDLLFLIELILDMEGIEVRRARGGKEALEILRAGPRPTLVILDVQMPDIDGWTVLREMRRDPATAEVPVLMCTVKASVHDLLEGWRLGCDGFVHKPFEIQGLRDAVRDACALEASERMARRRGEIALLERNLSTATGG